MDKITKLYWTFHKEEKFNFYKLTGFRSGYTGRPMAKSNFENLPESLVADYEKGYKEGKEISTKVQ